MPKGYPKNGKPVMPKRVQHVLRVCEVCGKERYYAPGQIRVREKHLGSPIRFCSTACMGKARMKDDAWKELDCEFCGKSFTRLRVNLKEHNYCSKACSDIGRKKQVEIKCSYCEKPLFRRQSWIKEHNYCSKACYLKDNAANPLYSSPEYIKAYMAEYQRNNRAALNLSKREWHANNKPKKLQSQKKYRQTHQGYVAAMRNARHANASIGDFTEQDWEDLKRFYNYQCLCCKRYEPEIKLERDHIIPVVANGPHNKLNIQPLCRSCNAQKSNKTIDFRAAIVITEV